MRINLNEEEIQTALTEYISNQGIDLSQKRVSVELTAGRGVNGHKADIEIISADSVDAVDSSTEMAVPDVPEEQQAIPFN